MYLKKVKANFNKLISHFLQIHSKSFAFSRVTWEHIWHCLTGAAWHLSGQCKTNCPADTGCLGNASVQATPSGSVQATPSGDADVQQPTRWARMPTTVWPSSSHSAGRPVSVQLHGGTANQKPQGLWSSQIHCTATWVFFPMWEWEWEPCPPQGISPALCPSPGC